MINFEYLSVKNNKSYNKPNEDYILFDLEKNIYIVLDGVSRDLENNKYPNPSPASDAARELGEGILNYLDNSQDIHINIAESLKNAIKHGNSIVRGYNEKFGHSFLAGAVGIVAYINGNKLYYSYIGDCIGAIISGDSLNIFTKQQTKLIREHKSKFTKDEIRNNICNNTEHPYCYGVLNGQNSATELLEHGKVALNDNDVLLLTTDGMEEIFNKFSPLEIKSKSCKELIEGVEILEDLYGFTDDKSIIKIQI